MGQERTRWLRATLVLRVINRPQDPKSQETEKVHCRESHTSGLGMAHPRVSSGQKDSRQILHTDMRKGDTSRSYVATGGVRKERNVSALKSMCTLSLDGAHVLCKVC